MKRLFKQLVSAGPRQLLVWLTIGGLASLSFTTKEDGDSLTLTINNVQKNGQLYVSLCTGAAEWTENGKYTFQFNAVSGENNTYKLTDIPKDRYAIALYQDLNGNGKLDTNFLGIPKEPYAFSNNIKPVFSTPSFKQCSFEFSQANQNLSIDL